MTGGFDTVSFYFDGWVPDSWVRIGMTDRHVAIVQCMMHKPIARFAAWTRESLV